MKVWINSMLEGSDGTISTTRFITLAVTMIIMGVYIAQNVAAMAKGMGFVDFPTNTVYILLIALGAKVGQHFSEALRDKAVKVAEEMASAKVEQTTQQ